MESLKSKIQKQKSSKAKAPAVQRSIIKTPAPPSTVLNRKMASSAAPEAYLGFNTGPVSRKTVTKKIINHDLSASQPSRKVARLTKSEITTSSWRKNAKNARKLLKQQSDIKFESKVSPNDIHKPVPMEQDADLHMDDEIRDEDTKSIVDEIKKNEIENILSPEVKDILKVKLLTVPALLASTNFTFVPVTGPSFIFDFKTLAKTQAKV